MKYYHLKLTEILMSAQVHTNACVHTHSHMWIHWFIYTHSFALSLRHTTHKTCAISKIIFNIIKNYNKNNWEENGKVFIEGSLWAVLGSYLKAVFMLMSLLCVVSICYL